MQNSLVSSFYVKAPQTKELGDAIAFSEKTEKPQTPVALTGLTGSSLSMVLGNAFENQNRPFLFILDTREEAAYYFTDLEKILDSKRVLYYPGSYRQPYHALDSEHEIDNANVLLRSEVLNQIQTGKKPAIVVTYPEALFEKVITQKELERSTLKVGVSDQLSIDFVNEVLFEYRFNRVDFVTAPGEFALRGGILDVFSFSHNKPYRIEFFGDEVDSIRTFDIESQLSVEQLSEIAIIPNIEHKTTAEQRESFLRYISPETVVFLKNKELACDALDVLFKKAEERFSKLDSGIKHGNPKTLFSDSRQFSSDLENFTTVYLRNPANSAKQEIQFHTRPQPSFNKQFGILIENLNENTKGGYKNYIFCSSEQQAKRFKDIFEDASQEVKQFQTIIFSLYQGFIDDDLKIACYTDHQIFERYHRSAVRSGYSKKIAVTLKELENLEVGDYVTHIDHGIGKFGGLQKIEVEGKLQEAIKLFYGDRDILYVSIHSLHKISKYNGKDGKEPRIYKLGSNAWKNLKQKTKKRVKEIAFDLITLYAKRHTQKGFAFNPDSYLQAELESSFIYEDTPDQSKATDDVKRDMESEHPMDRLVCGDVGFGKTEVAIRAAFKAVDNGKQVAVLVPTTILAFQHFQTFTERLSGLPVTVNYLNRFKTAKERRLILESLKDGSLDILIGTHQLVNKSVVFKDLGLLIIDEEQKFGVAVKDKLKTIKENVDTLTLSATPIPRTLQFSLMAARDLSLITTPPPNRYPVETHIIRFSKEIIRDAILEEISRGGQVFFVHNRIENIREIAGMLQTLIPDARIAVGHGQMEGKKLEKLMMDFINHEFDVLVSTTIIESGLDVTNANTIFINNANNFGLADLHQMRGRVGRSNKKAFCYFITPPYSVITDDARKRLESLEQFSDLGSGIHIAMKDLEIRGAGDLLGGEQSGFINEIGFTTYQKILQEAIEELKENEFKELYKKEKSRQADQKFIKEITLDSDFELLFPDDYINIVTERLNLYTALNEIQDEKELKKFEEELTDRFGPLPEQAVDLLNSVRIKWLAMKMGLERIIMKHNKMTGYFISDQEHDYYKSPAFSRVLEYVQHHPNKVSLTQRETRRGLRLIISFKEITSVDKALAVLRDFSLLSQKTP